MPWLHHTCGVCEFCARGEENLCIAADFTGWTVDGGYADAVTVPEAFAVRLPSELSDLEASTEPLVLVVGSEGRGISRLVRQTCDVVVSIPTSR